MNVVILAAGLSQRLFPLTKQKPKTVLPLFGNKSLLSCIFDSLKNNSKYFSQLTIVGGHGFTYLQQAIKSLDHIGSVVPTLIFNPNYQSMNNCYSLFMPIEHAINDDLLIINSDVLYEPNILDAIIQTPHTALVVDNKKTLTAESMKVYVKNGRITDISKQLSIDTSYGEYIGIAKIQNRDVPALSAALVTIIKHNPSLFYEDAFRSILRDVRFHVIDTDGLPWTEIDDPRDVIIAKQIYKKLYL